MTGFGCSAAYQAALFSRQSGALICRFDDRFDATWNRQIDATSAADFTFRDACCSCLPVPWAHEIALYRDGTRDPVWIGPVTATGDTGRELTVSAADRSAFWFRRSTSALITHAGAPVDAATLFSELVAQAEALSPTGLAFAPTLTGVMVDRVVPINQKIGPVLDDLSNGAIDWTVVAATAYAGGSTVPAGGDLVLVTSDHWETESPPQVITDGASQVTRVIVHASGDIVAIYPPGPAVPDPNFGIIEIEISKSQINSQTEADAYARSFWERHQGPQVFLTTSDSALSKRFPYDLSELIPGRLFNVDSNVACTDQLLTLRLSEVSVTISEGHEDDVTIDLQPVGQDANEPTA